MSATAGEETYRSLLEKKGYTIKLFNNHLDKKSPDFMVLWQGKIVFYCEVKDIEDLDNKYFETDLDCPDEVRIILQKIYDANNQFNSVNPDHNTPNILAFHCKRLGMDANDLHDALYGFVEYNGGFKLRRKHRGHVDARLWDKGINIDAFFFHHSNIDEYSAIYVLEDGFYGEFIKDLNLLEFKKGWGDSDR